MVDFGASIFTQATILFELALRWGGFQRHVMESWWNDRDGFGFWDLY
jgi:hypothetical protein